MQLGFCSISALDRSLAEAAETAAAVGFDAIEVTQRPPHLEEDAGEREARAAGEAVRAAGLDVVAYGSYLGRMGSRDPERGRHEAALAAAMGAPLLRVWAEHGEGDDDGFADTVALLHATCEAAAAHGITVVVERHVGSFADTPERIARLFAAVDRPELALNYQVLDLLPPDAIDAQPDDARRLAGEARYFHLKNYRPNPDEGGPLLPGGSLEGGALDYRALLPAALDAGYDGPLTLEFVSFEPIPLEEKLARDLAFVRGILAERDAAG